MVAVVMEPLSSTDIIIEFDDRDSEGSIITAKIVTPFGSLVVMVVVERFDRELVLARVHIQSENLGPNTLGPARVRRMVIALAEKLDVEAITIGGAVRTTGASARGARGRIPSAIRLARPLRS